MCPWNSLISIISHLFIADKLMNGQLTLTLTSTDCGLKPTKVGLKVSFIDACLLLLSLFYLVFRSVILSFALLYFYRRILVWFLSLARSACYRDDMDEFNGMGRGRGQVLSGGMGSEEDEHVVMCCFCPLLCPISISCYLLRLLITINAHFPFHFSPSLQLLKFLWNKRDDRLPIFQSANFLSPQVVSQIDAHR